MHFYAASSLHPPHPFHILAWKEQSKCNWRPKSLDIHRKKKIKEVAQSIFFFLVHKYDSLETQKQFHLYKKASFFMRDLLPHAAAYSFYLVYPTFMWWYKTPLQELSEKPSHTSKWKLQLPAISGMQ